jgi:hypothetical protein
VVLRIRRQAIWSGQAKSHRGCLAFRQDQRKNSGFTAGYNAWIRLGDSELAALTSIPLVESVPNIPNPVVSKVNPIGLARMFWWWVGLTGFSLLGDLILLISGVFRYEPGAVILVNIPWMAASILEYILTYRYWQTIQDGSTRTTPGKAVGFQFIPFFSIYWLFPAYFGLAQDQNRFIDRQFIGRGRKSQSLYALTYVILYWLWIAFMLFLTISTIIFDNSYYYGSMTLTFYNSQILIPIFIILGLSIILRCIMLIDFYLTTRLILKRLQADVEIQSP